MCGGDLEIAQGTLVAECEYCGTKQTVPKCSDENLQNVFNRATALRLKSEFDKAERLYENIVQSDPTQAEAYWGLLLCRYGIEYVDDPKTFKKIPTCHRASYESILEDGDYKLALTHADISQRSVYAAQAVEIDRIQKGILDLAKKEESYDVFICYKETDENGQRTVDSVIANDIYYQLTNEGFKVFYSAITLEGKLGSAYEPIIFAALNSAKVMLVIGTKPSYFNAVWVKNEWSRYVKISKQDKSRVLIPCYRDMDAYELPDEFSHLQAQDMSKIGFINDIVRGIKKIINNAEPAQTAVTRETVVANATVGVAPLIKRAFLFLEDGDWSSANEYCEKALDQDPENPEAYIAKLMVDLRITNQESLKDCATPFDDNNNYKKAIRFADDSLRSTLIGYIEHINARNENKRLERLYNVALTLMNKAHREDEYKEAADIFHSIIEYKNSEALETACLERAENAKNMQLQGIYNNALNIMNNAKREDEYKEAARLFYTIIKYKDSESLKTACLEKADHAKKDAILALATEKMQKNSIKSCEEAAELLASVRDWKNANGQLVECQEKIQYLKKKAKRNKKIAITALISCASIAAVAAIATVTIVVLITAPPLIKYNKMISLIDSNGLAEAYILCQELGDYKDCATIKEDIKEKIITEAENLYFSGDAHGAAQLLSTSNIADPGYYEVSIGDYRSAIKKGLTNIVIPHGITIIGDGTFSNCTNLTSIAIPNSVTSIGTSAFENCYNLTSITLPNSIKHIGDFSFANCSSIINITIPDSVTAIGNSAFYGCSNLTNVVLGTGITSINNGTFEDCVKLTSVTIPNSVKRIGTDAFYNCESLKNITLNDDLTEIGDFAFYSCKHLTSIRIGNNVKKIGIGAFVNCYQLTRVTFHTPNGWRISTSSTFNGSTGIPSSNLSNPSTAAKYLISTYCSYYWARD